MILGGRDNWKGKISYYRYHIQDPVMFQKSIRVTIEHGHAEPPFRRLVQHRVLVPGGAARAFPPLPPVEGRLARVNPWEK